MGFERHLIDEITTILIQQKIFYAGVIGESSKGRNEGRQERVMGRPEAAAFRYPRLIG